MNVRLRPARAADVPWLAGWVPAVANTVGYGDAGDASAIGVLLRDRSCVARVIELDEAAVGLAIATVRAGGSAIVEFVGTVPEEARRGAGMRAAALLEADLRRRRARRLYAPAPEVHGIAMYFWTRLGYRPLLRPSWPCERAGVAWLARDV